MWVSSAAHAVIAEAIIADPAFLSLSGPSYLHGGMLSASVTSGINETCHNISVMAEVMVGAAITDWLEIADVAIPSC